MSYIAHGFSLGIPALCMAELHTGAYSSRSVLTPRYLGPGRLLNEGQKTALHECGATQRHSPESVTVNAAWATFHHHRASQSCGDNADHTATNRPSLTSHVLAKHPQRASVIQPYAL